MTYRKSAEGLVMAFEYTLQPSITKTDHILFAYAQPFTKTDIERSIDIFEGEMRNHNSDIYFHREVLINSLEGNPMHYLTVTWRNLMIEADEIIDNKESTDESGRIPDQHGVLYPQGGQGSLQFNKPTIFISSRVHCGETCASFFLQGIFDFLS